LEFIRKSKRQRVVPDQRAAWGAVGVCGGMGESVIRYHRDRDKFDKLMLSKKIAVRIIRNLEARKHLFSMDSLVGDIADEIYEEMVDTIGIEINNAIFKQGL
jgi:hypothetical protein